MKFGKFHGERNAVRFITSLALVELLTMMVTFVRAETYTYDLSGRLTQVAYTNGARVEYVYDDAGNITSISGLSKWISTNGNGLISPNLVGKTLTVGKKYTVTAKPSKGYVFAGWTGTVVSRNPKLTFTAAADTAIEATFIKNPFPPAAGSYAGLFYATNGVTETNAGSLTGKVTSAGAMSAKLQLAGASYSLSGQFFADGTYSNSILQKGGASRLVVQLLLDLNGGDEISGTISNSAWVAVFDVNRLIYDTETNAAPQAGNNYTFYIPGSTNSAELPGGCGFGALSVSRDGTVTVKGALGDGTKLTQATFVSKLGQWPLYSQLYSGKGQVLGWVTFTNNAQTQNDIQGKIGWFKPNGGKLYAEGFDWPYASRQNLFGSIYSNTAGADLLPWTNGALILANGKLSRCLTNGVSLAVAGKKGSGDNKLNLKVTASSGLFTGSVVGPDSPKPTPFCGVLMKNGSAGYGYFLGNGQSGSVRLAGTGPYNGLWQAIPGEVRLGDFDLGGEGIAYHNPWIKHWFPYFRPDDDLDIYWDGITGNYGIGCTTAGEWIDYSVNVQRAGTYVALLSVANITSGSIVHLEVDGRNLSGAMTLPATASFQTYQTIQGAEMNLTSGHHVLRLVLDVEGGGPGYGIGNIHGLTIVDNVDVPARLLKHRYGFSDAADSTTVTDSVSGANGAVFGGAAFNGASLTLDGESYVQLPSGIISCLNCATFEMWIAPGNATPLLPIFNFGEPDGAANGKDYIYLAPYGLRNVHFAITPLGWTNESPVLNGTAIPVGVKAHIAVTYDYANLMANLYVNGALVASAPVKTPLSALHDINNWLGRSQFTTTSYLLGTYDEFRIYDGVLTPAQIQRSYSAGPDAPLAAP
jgi:YD repeat-containing protein